MSVEASAWAWNLSAPPNGKLVLLAIADHADPYGRNAWPSHETIARKTGYSVRQVKRIIDALVGADLITVAKANLPNRRPDRQPNAYTLHMATGVTVRRDEWQTGSCPPELRTEVIEAFQHTCATCDRQGTEALDPDGHPWEVDRIRPSRQGGRYTADNVALSCRSCNRRGDIMTPRESDRTGGHLRPNGGTSPTERGDTRDPLTVLEPSIEPSAAAAPDELTRALPPAAAAAVDIYARHRTDSTPRVVNPDRYRRTVAKATAREHHDALLATNQVDPIDIAVNVLGMTLGDAIVAAHHLQPTGATP